MREFTGPRTPLPEAAVAEGLVTRARAAGLQALLAGELEESFYHEYLPGQQPALERLRDILPSQFLSLVQKPTQGLWTAPLVATGTHSTWQQWHGETAPSREQLLEVQLAPRAVVLELREGDLPALNAWVNQEDGGQQEPGVDLRLACGVTFSACGTALAAQDDGYSVPWWRLKELGVSAVRVHGERYRGTFYGWDCDSMVVLRAAAVAALLP